MHVLRHTGRFVARLLIFHYEEEMDDIVLLSRGSIGGLTWPRLLCQYVSYFFNNSSCSVARMSAEELPTIHSTIPGSKTS